MRKEPSLLPARKTKQKSVLAITISSVTPSACVSAPQQKRLIQEIKMVLRVLVLYIPLPMFWALFDQQVCEGRVAETSPLRCAPLEEVR